MRIGGQRIVFEIHKYIVVICSFSGGGGGRAQFELPSIIMHLKFITNIIIHVITSINLSKTKTRTEALKVTENRQNKLSYVAKK